MLTEPNFPFHRDEAMANYFSLMGAAPFSINAAGDITWRYPHDAARLLRCSNEAPRTQESFNASLDITSRRARKTAQRSLNWDGACYRLSYSVDGLDGRKFWLEERGQRISKDIIQCVIRDIDLQKGEQKKAVYNHEFDARTGLINRQALMKALGTSQDILNRFNQRGLFLALKCTNLSDINKSYSYDVGDKVLCAFANRLREHIKSPDSVGVMNGSHFGIALLLPEQAQPEQLAAALIDKVSKENFMTAHGPIKLQISVAAIGLQGNVPPELILRRTQKALDVQPRKSKPYQFIKAVQSGASPDNTSEIGQEDILTALNTRRLSLAYQPIIDAQDTKLHHFECLLRLEDEHGDVNPAGRFIVAAERLNLVHLLDRRALEMASETLMRKPDVHLALNVSAQTVMDRGTSRGYLEALRGLGPALKRVTLELTETAALEDPAKAADFAAQARRLGCAFAIDDFGAGHTSFQNLLAIEADSVKIDGSYIEELTLSEHKQTFIRMMVDLAQTFGVKTVAERVETKAQAELLKRLGVDYLQGYYYAMPSAVPIWNRSLI